jgi:hypothetical protein
MRSGWTQSTMANVKRLRMFLSGLTQVTFEQTLRLGLYFTFIGANNVVRPWFAIKPSICFSDGLVHGCLFHASSANSYPPNNSHFQGSQSFENFKAFDLA